jgi:hypothetical protein
VGERYRMHADYMVEHAKKAKKYGADWPDGFDFEQVTRGDED